MKTNILIAVSFLALSSAIHAAPIDIADAPIFVNSAVPPLNLLVMAKDHKLYYEAYTDNADLDGDNVIDVGYKPGQIDYFGYFNSNVCYTHDGGKFKPSSATVDKKCSGKWSGDFLNYLATSRMDALRKVLYGGFRSVDKTDETVLQAAYIPQDGHSWGKEYFQATDNYNISDYSPLSEPASGYYHLFAVTTLNRDRNSAPVLRVLRDTKYRIWDWVSKEAPVAGDICWGGASCTSKGPSGNSPSIANYEIRVEVCQNDNADYREDNCQPYANSGGSAIYKPTGLLHDFGADDKMYFGLLTGSYQKNIDGGVLRNNIDSFTKEIDAQTGIYKTGVNGIVSSINNLKLYGFEGGHSTLGGSYTGCGLLLSNPLDLIANQKCHMWGNPVAEMMYEGLRYFSGASAATSKYKYSDSNSVDEKLDLQQPAWQSPYRATGGYPECAKPVMTVISDITPSYDYNVPGSKWGSAVSSDPSLASLLNVSAQVDAIWAAEGGGNRLVFIGESNGINDYAPSPKIVSNLSTVRGLSPEEPSKSGTYYSAGIARFGAKEGINANSTTNNKMMTYAIALASPLPQIKFPVGGENYVTVVPFGKSVYYSSPALSPLSDFQPTLTIVDFYVQKLANMDPKGSDKDTSINDGRPYAQFRINYEDVEQGNDHDMDAIVLYTIYMDANNKLIIKLDKEYDGAGIHMHMGYMVSGTTKDGIYLEVRNKGNTAYRLNTPPNQDPGYCMDTSKAGCKTLPESTTRTFEPANKIAAELLPGPLWYAAKYGMPDRNPATVDGDPDNYFLVTNALTLKDQLTKAFNDIMQKNAAVTRPAIGKAPIGPSVAQERDLYRTEFDAEKWTGSVIKETLSLTDNQPSPVWVSSIPTNRAVKIANIAGTSLVEFTWGNLGNRKYITNKNLRFKLRFDGSGERDNKHKERIDYINGDRTEEGGLFRERSSLLGDIVNSSPVLVSGGQYIPYLANKLFGTDNYAAFSAAQSVKTPMLYVGANDGMLHGFDADTGIETFAFIPTPVIENLNLLTDKGYGVTGEGLHKYFVDGSLHVSDVYIDGQWKTILVGALGAGGRGIFVLDVTTPTDIKLLWEFNEDSLGSKNVTNGLSDLGYTFGNPTIIKVKSGKWVVALNSGYNSPNAESGIASLFLLDVATGEVVSKLDAQGATTNNGLSSMRVADYNGDGVADYIYSGDIQGNLWRFDLTKDTPLISYDSKPMFKSERPITAPPSLVRHPSGRGYLIVIGTGRYLANSDKIPPFEVDTVYGIWDQKTKGEATTALMAIDKADLLKQDFFLQTIADIGDDSKKVTQEIRLLTNYSPDWSTSGHKGWSIDLNILDNTDFDGERMVDEMVVRGSVLFFTTRKPSIDPCESGVEGWTYVINPFTGGRTNFNVLDLNRNLLVGKEDGYLYKNTLIPVTGFKAPPGGFILTGDKMISSDGTVIDYQPKASRRNRENWFIIPKDKAE